MVRKHAGAAAINTEWETVVVKVGFFAAVRARWHYRPLANIGQASRRGEWATRPCQLDISG